MTQSPELSWEPDPQTGSVEMPDAVVGMETRDGRLLVTLADGRTIDMTDWFESDPEKAQ